MNQDHENRIKTLEARVNTLTFRCENAEGRAASFEQALLGVLEVLALSPPVYFAVQRRLNEDRVKALNSGESEQKVDSADGKARDILAMMEAEIKNAQ